MWYETIPMYLSLVLKLFNIYIYIFGKSKNICNVKIKKLQCYDGFGFNLPSTFFF